jgi:CSLREA domain-containing protein
MKRNLRQSVLLPLALLIGFTISIGATIPGSASSAIQVNSFVDSKRNDGECSLREAVIAANKDKKSGGKHGECIAGSGPDTILLPAGTYILSRTDSGNEDSSSIGDLDIKDDLIILGTGPGTVISAEPHFSNRIFHVLEGSVTISGTLIMNGDVSGSGGGIYNRASLTLENVTIKENTASASGGGLFNGAHGAAFVQGSTITANTAGGDGGGLAVGGGSVTLVNNTLSGNSAKNDGGASLCSRRQRI